MLGPVDRYKSGESVHGKIGVDLLGPKHSPNAQSIRVWFAELAVKSKVHLERVQHGIKLRNEESVTVEVRVVYLGFFLGPPLIRVEQPR